MNYRFIFIASISVFILVGAYVVFAQSNPFDIQFPIAKLGNCNSIEECKAYCDNAENQEACSAWAKSEGIRTGGERHARISEKGGPGGCKSEEECQAYCEVPENRVTCIDFAEKEGFMTAEEANRARTFIQKEKEGFNGPGGCDSQESCKAYCQNPEHIQECVLNAVENGFMQKEEADRILSFIQSGTEAGITGVEGFGKPQIPSVQQEPRINKEKALKILEAQGGPGGCSTFKACETFCDTPGNENICLDFAAEHDLIKKEELEKFKKIAASEGPGGCRGKQCHTYCEEPGHETECLEFAHKNGLIKKEEFEQIKKFVDAASRGGPGGCQGRQCEAYCNDPAHHEECFAFAKENNLLPKEEIEKNRKTSE